MNKFLVLTKAVILNCFAIFIKVNANLISLKLDMKLQGKILTPNFFF